MRTLRSFVSMAMLLGGLLSVGGGSARALDVELRDVAPDRVERQRAYYRGAVPLPRTPDISKLDERLAAKGLSKGSPVFVRIFKESSELELWMKKGDTFTLLDIYPICHWTGSIGPKLKEGDKQSPEGFYSVGKGQMRHFGRWEKAFNIGYPNLHDQVNRRSGSFILVHGGCSSVGCFAMTEQVQEEIYGLAAAALAAGQERFHIHIFPFRMTEAELAAHGNYPWRSFWEELKAGYESFERTQVPPRIGVCRQRYQVMDASAGDIGSAKPLGHWRPASSSEAAACVPEIERVAGRQTINAAIDELGEPRRRVRRVSPSIATSADDAPGQADVPIGFGGRRQKNGASRAVSDGS